MIEPNIATSNEGTWIEIDLRATERNFGRFASAMGEARIIASVKKEAYGHGIVEVARTLAGQSRLESFGVWSVREAARLREAGLSNPILLFTVARGRDLKGAIELGATLTITSEAEAREAAEAAASLDSVARAHLKIDTGLTRLGRTPEEALREVGPIGDLKRLELAGLYTHFSDAWDDPASARAQFDLLERFARDAGLGALPRHIGGSDVVSLGAPPPGYCIRAGLALHGYHAGVAGLEPVMTMKSRVIYRRRAAEGTKVSYAGTHVLRRDSELALVGAGYGNGLALSLTAKGRVLIGGRRFPILGQVCMDQVIVDVTEAPHVAVGDEVVLIGRQGEEMLGADEVARLAGSSTYEVLCVAGGLNARFYPGQALSERAR